MAPPLLLRVRLQGSSTGSQVTTTSAKVVPVHEPAATTVGALVAVCLRKFELQLPRSAQTPAGASAWCLCVPAGGLQLANGAMIGSCGLSPNSELLLQLRAAPPGNASGASGTSDPAAALRSSGGADSVEARSPVSSVDAAARVLAARDAGPSADIAAAAASSSATRLPISQTEQVLRISVPDANFQRVMKCDRSTTVDSVVAGLVERANLEGSLFAGDPGCAADWALFCPDRSLFLDAGTSLASYRFPPVQALVYRRRQATVTVQLPAACSEGAAAAAGSEGTGEEEPAAVSVTMTFPPDASVFDVQEAAMCLDACSMYVASRGGQSAVRQDHALFLEAKGRSVGLRLEPTRSVVSYRLKTHDVVVWMRVPKDEILSSRASLERYNDIIFVSVSSPSHGVSKTLKVRAAATTVSQLMDQFLDRSGLTVRNPLAYGLVLLPGQVGKGPNANAGGRGAAGVGKGAAAGVSTPAVAASAALDGGGPRNGGSALAGVGSGDAGASASGKAAANFLNPTASLSEVGCTNLCQLQLRQRRKAPRSLKDQSLRRKQRAGRAPLNPAAGGAGRRGGGAAGGGGGGAAGLARRSVFKTGIDSLAIATVSLPDAPPHDQPPFLDAAGMAAVGAPTTVTVPSMLQQLRLLLRRQPSSGPRGFGCEGIFRLAASESRAKECKGILNSEVPLLDVNDRTGASVGDAMVTEDTLKLFDPHVVATLLKRWVGQLSPRVMDLTDATVSAAEVEAAVAAHGSDPAGAFDAVVVRLLARRQPRRCEIYVWLLDTLCEAVLAQAENKMSAANIAIVVAPQLVDLDAVDPMAGLALSGKVTQLLQLHVVFWLRTVYGFDEPLPGAPPTPGAPPPTRRGVVAPSDSASAVTAAPSAWQPASAAGTNLGGGGNSGVGGGGGGGGGWTAARAPGGNEARAPATAWQHSPAPAAAAAAAAPLAPPRTAPVQQEQPPRQQQQQQQQQQQPVVLDWMSSMAELQAIIDSGLGDEYNDTGGGDNEEEEDEWW